MFSFLTRKKKQSRAFSARQELERLAEISPPSALVTLLKADGKDDEGEDLGKAFFLRRDKKLYTEGNHLYLTTPDNLKISRDQSMTSRPVSLRFFSRRIPYRIKCLIVGRFRLLPEVVETLDFSAKAAFKLQPITPLRKQDKRQFFRYSMKNYGDSRIPLTTHITFDAFAKATNKEYPDEGAPPGILNDLTTTPYHVQEQTKPFTTHGAIESFREIMLRKQPHERSVTVTKVLKDDSGSLFHRKDEELLLGECSILGLEMESLRDVLYVKKSAKAVLRKARDNPYNARAGDKLLTHFMHDGKYYQMLCEVMESRTQQEVIRPLEMPTQESGLALTLVDYSVGGILVEGSADLLRLLLGDSCPPNIEDENDFQGSLWSRLLDELRKPMVHLTFYPRLYFPDAVKRYMPELPFRINLLAQIVRYHVRQITERRILQLGLQFTYEPQGIPMQEGDSVDWRYTRHVRDNEHFVRAHSQLSQLYGYLENQSLASGVARPLRRRSASADDS